MLVYRPRLPLRRCWDFEARDEEERGNPLPHARSRVLEYAVHGKWRRSEGDKNGVFGTWYVGVPELVETFGEAAVTDKLAAFAAAQAAARSHAVSAAAAAAEAAERGGEEAA